MASIAAGRGGYQTPDSTGVAPGATLYDVRVLDERGVGTVADLLVGIDWVLQRARFHNIRVMNLSLAANGTDSFLVDPLARAARSAVAAGIVVVASASNAGKNDAGAEVYGAISSPGIEPSVITVGAANPHGHARSAATTRWPASARAAPPAAACTLPSGKRWVDNVLKPDLVAPGNRLLGAVANKKNQAAPSGNVLATLYPSLMQGAQAQGAAQVANEELMQLSGTSVAAPAVAGAAAVLLQANPGLTPPLVKAILQYTAQPLPGANLLQQGAGQLNVEGAVRLAQALRTDIAQRAGRRHAEGRATTCWRRASRCRAARPRSTAQTFDWGRIAFAGGSHLVSGDALFTDFQPIYDPGLTWVRQVALRNTVQYLPASAAWRPTPCRRPSSRPTPRTQPLLTPRRGAARRAGRQQLGQPASGMFAPTADMPPASPAQGFILSRASSSARASSCRRGSMPVQRRP